jgi:hypothetical protein
MLFLLFGCLDIHIYLGLVGYLDMSFLSWRSGALYHVYDRMSIESGTLIIVMF